MHFQIYLFIDICFMLYNSPYFAAVEALIGENIRSAEENEFPFIVAVTKNFVSNNIPSHLICTGSLISRNDVLTSEHCISDEDLTGLSVLVGSSHLDCGTVFYPEWWISYDQWANNKNYLIIYSSNDIALINLFERVSDSIEPLHVLVSSKQSLYGMEVTIAAWGLLQNGTIPNTLQVGKVTILSKEACEHRILSIGQSTLNADERIICSVSEPYLITGPGDSGSPMFQNNLIIGINVGTAPGSLDRFDPNLVNIHMHVNYFNDFISNMKDYFR